MKYSAAIYFANGKLHSRRAYSREGLYHKLERAMHNSTSWPRFEVLMETHDADDDRYFGLFKQTVRFLNGLKVTQAESTAIVNNDFRR